MERLAWMSNFVSKISNLFYYVIFGAIAFMIFSSFSLEHYFHVPSTPEVPWVLSLETVHLTPNKFSWLSLVVPKFLNILSWLQSEKLFLKCLIVLKNVDHFKMVFCQSSAFLISPLTLSAFTQWGYLHLHRKMGSKLDFHTNHFKMLETIFERATSFLFEKL